jgi:hypothetical protein
MEELDESLEREGYEISNSLNKCEYHLCELDHRGDCPFCRQEYEYYVNGY